MKNDYHVANVANSLTGRQLRKKKKKFAMYIGYQHGVLCRLKCQLLSFPDFKLLQGLFNYQMTNAAYMNRIAADYYEQQNSEVQLAYNVKKRWWWLYYEYDDNFTGHFGTKAEAIAWFVNGGR